MKKQLKDTLKKGWIFLVILSLAAAKASDTYEVKPEIKNELKSWMQVANHWKTNFLTVTHLKTRDSLMFSADIKARDRMIFEIKNKQPQKVFVAAKKQEPLIIAKELTREDSMNVYRDVLAKLMRGDLKPIIVKEAE